MLTKISAFFLAMLMPVVVAFNSISIKLPMIGETASLSYEFADENAGTAGGTVTVTASVGGNYKLYWGTEDGEKLSVDVGDYTAYYSEFATVSVSGGEGSAEIQQFTAIPDGAETILIYSGAIQVGSEEIPENKIADNGEMLYNFGALSDVHFNRYNGSLSGDDACVTFPNALNFLEALDVSLVGISGDISANGERDSFEKYNSIASEYDFPVYTCTGNHDVNDKFTLENWQELMNTGVYGETKANGVETVADNGLDFVYIPEESKGDVFIFLSQYRWDYNEVTSRILTDEQLDWLEAQLEKYSDEESYRCKSKFLRKDEDGKLHLDFAAYLDKYYQ